MVLIPSPSATDVGDTDTLRGALYTVTLNVFLIPLWLVTVIVAEPAFTPLSRPAALTVTTFVLLLLNV